jgi:sugar phosphate isomerase/epimerase
MSTIATRLAVVSTALCSDLRRAVEIAHAEQLHGLLLDAYSSHLNLPDLSASGKRELIRMLGSRDVRLVGLQGHLGATGLRPGADIDRVLDRITGAMEAAAALSSPMLCLDVGPLPAPAQVESPKALITPEQAGLLIIPEPAKPATVAAAAPRSAEDQAFADHLNAALSELGRRADRLSVTIAFSSSLAAFGSLSDALVAVRCPWFGIDFDPVAAVSDEWSMDEIFSRLGASIRHVRIRDAVRGNSRRTQAAIVGRGSIEWAAMLNRLDAAGYSGWLTIDPRELVEPRAAVTSARKLLVQLSANP